MIVQEIPVQRLLKEVDALEGLITNGDAEMHFVEGALAALHWIEHQQHLSPHSVLLVRRNERRGKVG